MLFLSAGSTIVIMMRAQLHGGVWCDAKVGLDGDKALWEQVLGVVVIDCRQDDHILTLCPVCWRRYLVHTRGWFGFHG